MKNKEKQSYLSDFKRNAEGEFVYTGKVYTLSDSALSARNKAIVLTALLALSVIGSGLINGAGMNNTFYVIIPYILEVSCLFAVLWNFIRFLSSGKAVKEYVFNSAAKHLPPSAAALAVFSSAGLVCSVVFSVLNKTENSSITAGILYPCLKAVSTVLSLFLRHCFGEIKKTNAE